MSVIDSASLRQAFGAFATGVTIITCQTEDGTVAGLTANSFTTVSLTPPLVLFCIGSGRESYQAFAGCRHFCINVLSQNQQDLSTRFAKSGESKWAGLMFHRDAYGSPCFPGSAATFSCRKTELIRAGDHALVIGEVTRIEHHPGLMPLIYCRSQYHSIEASRALID